MFEDIQKHRQAVRENIEKSLQIGFTESEDFEKAHQVGDIHPNGKWVWTQLPSGKFDWRVIKSKQGDYSAKNSSSKQADDIVLTNEDYDRVFHNVGLSRQTLFEHNNRPYILKIFGKRFDGSYIISVHNGDTEKKLKGDSNIAISVKRAFINQLKQEKLRDIERNAKKKQAESTDDTQSDDKENIDKLTNTQFLNKFKIKDIQATVHRGKRSVELDVHSYRLSNQKETMEYLRSYVKKHGVPVSVSVKKYSTRNENEIKRAAFREDDWRYSEGEKLIITFKDGTKEDFVARY